MLGGRGGRGVRGRGAAAGLQGRGAVQGLPAVAAAGRGAGEGGAGHLALRLQGGTAPDAAVAPGRLRTARSACNTTRNMLI
jgi:hypothetical protein